MRAMEVPRVRPLANVTLPLTAVVSPMCTPKLLDPPVIVPVLKVMALPVVP